MTGQDNKMQETKIVRLDNAKLSLVLLVRAAGAPEIAYFGTALAAGDLAAVSYLRARNQFHNSIDVDIVQASLLPTLGIGNFNPAAMRGRRETGDWGADFKVSNIKKSGGSLTLTMLDETAGLRLTTDLVLAKDSAVLEMRNTLTCLRGVYTLDDLAAGVMVVPDSARELLVHDGQWCNEFNERRFVLDSGTWAAENRKGRTSHDHFPQVILGTPGFGEYHGQVYAFHLGWSGNHKVAVDVLDDGRRLVRLGEFLHPGEITLKKGESYATPKLYVSCAHGLNALSNNFHAFTRGHILHWPQGAMRARPITLNTWEGNYFAHDMTSLKAQADAAAALGIERFVLDDGWFGLRDDDSSSLGDWHIDKRKYPDGLTPLIDHVRACGMEFGLWVEPEMINPDSDLYRAHPDWVLTTQGRPLITGRKQLVLDMTRAEVADHLFGWLDALLCDNAISYFKWDMNRDLVAASGVNGKPAYHGQVQALYALLARLRAAHPDVEIETCASGGGRIDFGVLPFTHRVWTSDCTDATERVRIQRGYSRFFPPELMGAHVSNSPGHQTARRHSLSWRAAVAFFGHMGMEMDPRHLAADEAAELTGWFALHKRLRHILHSGAFIGFDEVDHRHARGAVSADKNHAVVGIYQTQSQSHKSSAPFYVHGLNPKAQYRITLPQPALNPAKMWSAGQLALLGGQIVVSGELLAKIGLIVPELKPESALILEFNAVREF